MSTAQAGYPLTRRGFLTSAAGAALAAAIAPATRLMAAAADAPTGSRVVKVTSPRVIEGLQVGRSRLRKMIDYSLTRLSGQGRVGDAWARYARPGRKVLLKFTRLPGEGLATEPAMLDALLDSLRRAGHKLSDITVAGCPAAQRIDGLRPTPVGWSHRRVRWGGHSEQVRRYLDDAEVVINVPSITDHNLAGVACALMNVSLPLIRRPARYYDGRVHETIASICADSKTLIRPSLTLVNALRCVYDGGPIVDPEHIGYERGVWASTDPVAIDCLAAEWIERRRKLAGLPDLATDQRPPTYIDLAGSRGLGTSDRRRISTETHQM